jgi:hypothetical protein
MAELIQNSADNQQQLSFLNQVSSLLSASFIPSGYVQLYTNQGLGVNSSQLHHPFESPEL